MCGHLDLGRAFVDGRTKAKPGYCAVLARMFLVLVAMMERRWFEVVSMVCSHGSLLVGERVDG